MHVINLHGAKCESRRNVKIESAAEHNGPCRVALARSNPNKAPGVAEKRMSKEQHTATRIKELRTHREIAQVHLRAVLPSQLHLNPYAKLNAGEMLNPFRFERFANPSVGLSKRVYE